MKRKLLTCLASLCLSYVGIAYAMQEMIMVQTKFEGNVRYFQFTVNGRRYAVCTGGSEFCPSRQFISIGPDIENTFDLYDYHGSHTYNISDSCRNKIIKVKPHTGQTIIIARDNSNIVCNYL